MIQNIIPAAQTHSPSPCNHLPQLLGAAERNQKRVLILLLGNGSDRRGWKRSSVGRIGLPLLLKRCHSWSTLVFVIGAPSLAVSPNVSSIESQKLTPAGTLEFVKEEDDLQSPPYLPLGATLAAQQETHDCLQTAWAQLFLSKLWLLFFKFTNPMCFELTVKVLLCLNLTLLSKLVYLLYSFSWEMDSAWRPPWLGSLSFTVVRSRVVSAISFGGDFATDRTTAEILYTP